jgi:hypothetical protein
VREAGWIDIVLEVFMPIYITGSDVVQKFVRVEYRSLNEEQQKLRCEKELADDHPNSIGYAIRNFTRLRDLHIGDEAELSEYPELARMSVGLHIYGSGGWHRYYVRATGEVCFSAHHSTEEAQSLAQRAGFGLFQ